MSDTDNDMAAGMVKREEAGEPRVCRLWLVRHGVTSWNVERRLCGQQDIPLSERGWAQARWLARRLRLEHIGAIYTSDLQRAYDTARIIAQQQPTTVPFHILPAWREMSFGDWEGLTYEQIAATYRSELNFFTDPVHTVPPGGEPFSHLVQRVHAAFIDLARSSVTVTGDIVLVSHGGTLRTLLCSLLAIPFERQWQLQLDHGSLSAIDVVPGAEDIAATASLALLNVRALPRVAVREENNV